MKCCLLFMIFFLGLYSNSAFTASISRNNGKAGLPPGQLQQQQHVYYWTGFIKERIPVFMWIVVKDGIMQGELTYTKSKNHVGIRVLGTLPKNKEDDIRLCEYKSNGTITGIFTFKHLGDSVRGIWYATQNKQELVFSLAKMDTMITNMDTSCTCRRISGTYAYGKEGYAGDMEVKKVSAHKISFTITSVTNAPTHALAIAGPDTVKIYNNQFFYSMPDTDSCRFKVMFFRDFVYIRQVTSDDCFKVFGLNAGVDGIFIRTSK